MRWFDASPRRATPKGHKPSSSAQHHAQPPNYPWRPPAFVAHPSCPGSLVDTKITSDRRDRLPGLPHHPHCPLTELASNFLRFSGMTLLIADASTVRGELQFEASTVLSFPWSGPHLPPSSLYFLLLLLLLLCCCPPAVVLVRGAWVCRHAPLPAREDTLIVKSPPGLSGKRWNWLV